MEMLIIVIIISMVVAGIICAVMYSSMKPVANKKQANNYISTGGVKLTARNDLYVRTTESVRMLGSGNNGNNGNGISMGGPGQTGRPGQMGNRGPAGRR